MHIKDADGMANSVDPDQTAPSWAVWSGSALFAQTICPNTQNFFGTYLLTLLMFFNRKSVRAGTSSLLTSGIAASRRYKQPCKVDTLLARWVLFKPLAIIFTSLSAVVESLNIKKWHKLACTLTKFLLRCIGKHLRGTTPLLFFCNPSEWW